MIDLRKKIFIIAGITVGVIVAFILLYLYVYAPKIRENKVNEVINQAENQAQNIQQNQNIITTPIIPPGNPDEVYAKQVAKMFVERFGTNSNQNDNRHIEEVSSLVTSEMSAWIKTQMQKQSNEYKGMDTKLISSSIQEINDKSATVLVGVQINEQDKNTSKTIYRTGKVTLVKVGSDWKVDGLYWDKE